MKSPERRHAISTACVLLFCCSISCTGPNGPSEGSDDPPPGDGGEGPTYVAIETPAPRKDARFGETMCAVDWDGDGLDEIAIGAPGEGAVYLAARDGGNEPHWSVGEVLNAAGVADWPVQAAHDLFGGALVATQLDADPAQELVVGAGLWDRSEEEPDRGAVFVFGLRDDPREPVRLDTPWPAEGHFGIGVGAGDFDGDGHGDLAIGAPWIAHGVERAGSAQVVFGPFEAIDGGLESVLLDNPHPATDGSFGVHLAAQDSLFGQSLIVSAMGNDSLGGERTAGQVFVYPGPVDPHNLDVLEDPTPDEEDPPRFGMHVTARASRVSVGAPRKDMAGVTDSGLGFLFQESGWVRTFLHEKPEDQDILGFRCALADVVEGPELDVLYLSLKRALYVWSGDDLLGPSVLQIHKPSDAGDHHGMGIGVGQLVPGGREEVLVGDPTWDRPDHGPLDDVGRGGLLLFD